MLNIHSVEGDVGASSVEHEGLVDCAETMNFVLGALDALNELSVLALNGADMAGGCK
jgi:hypothetical protein